MTYQTQGVTLKSKQSMFHELDLFQKLAETLKLYTKTTGPSGNFLIIPTDHYDKFQELTETEKYFTLLQTLWCEMDWSKLAGGLLGSLAGVRLDDVFDALTHCKVGEKLDVEETNMFSDGSEYLPLIGNFVAYLSYFGFWQVERERETQSGYIYKVEFRARTITVTEFGKKMMKLLNEHRLILDWNKANPHYILRYMHEPNAVNEDIFNGEVEKPDIDHEENEKMEPFIKPFIPLFPEGELSQTLAKPEAKWRDGTYTFKVSLWNGVWRRIEMKATHTLSDLHMAIQEAFDFDNDHLYAFYMDNKRFSDNCFNASYMDEGPYAEDAELGLLDIVKGQEFLYLFDFGHEWRFTIKFEKVDPKTSENERPTIIEKRGDAPDQYSW